MDNALECIWKEQCGTEDCEKHCDCYSPYDTYELDKKYHLEALRENTEEYMKIIESFSD